MKESRFITLTDYCVVEYMFEEVGSLDFITDDWVLLENENAEIHQIFNTDASFFTTRNIQDLTVTPMSANKHVYLDSEKVPNYIDFDNNINELSITGFNVIMDVVRFHFVSGFDFKDLRALILSVRHKENDNTVNLFANILFAPETSSELLTFNPRPLFLGGAVYDRYVDISVPSIKNINDEYDTAAVPSTTFVAAITPTVNDTNGTGFITNGNFEIGLGECEKREKLYTDAATYDVFEITDQHIASLPQTNEFDNLGTSIDESTVGDFIEFYLTFNDAFPADLIAILNNRNPQDDWIIVHQISVFEQVGSSFIPTVRQIFFQEDSFDEPMIFRPVLKNANEAVSMTIDYLARLLNRRNGDQIIREGSFTQLSPKKYGKKLIKIPLLGVPQSQKVFNKLIKKDFEASKLFVEPNPITSTESDLAASSTKIIEEIVYVPMFFDKNSVNLGTRNLSVKVNDESEDIIFGQGKLRFILSPFDNLLKFKVFTFETDKSNPFDLNINASYNIVFKTAGGKVKFTNLQDQSKENLSEGEVVFRIPKKEAELITQSNDREFFITAIGQDGTETLLYSGRWNLASEQDQVNAAIAEAKNETNEKKQMDAKLTDITDKINKNTLQIQKDKVSLTKPFGKKSVHVDIPGYVKKKKFKIAGSVNKFKPTKDISKSKKEVKPDKATKIKSGAENKEKKKDKFKNGASSG